MISSAIRFAGERLSRRRVVERWFDGQSSFRSDQACCDGGASHDPPGVLEVAQISSAARPVEYPDHFPSLSPVSRQVRSTISGLLLLVRLVPAL
jgi:hypothetical protein